ncbi:UNVERIFIED_CONTAM: hypothetical protein RMT77_008386 [Armadillidium vulgare]
MEAVKIFNAELAGLYECKPPISKAKMTAITKAAIRAIKFYKHVVQSVEKFIQKCKTEYKIPGLYVIDSIVRQSRHQFSIEKDVFAPRFAKNITVTFYYLFKCPVEDKSKVIRVLNLWQKNHVFAEDVIQPLFDLADPNHSIHKEVGNLIAQKANKTKVVPAHHTPQQQTPQYQHTPQYSQVSQSQQQQALHISQQPTITTTTSTITNASIASINDTVVPVSNQENVGTSTSVVSSLDPNLIHQIQQILLKTEEGTPVASAVAALSLQPPHTIPPVSQSLPQIPPPVSLPPPQTSTCVSLSVSTLQENKQGIHSRVPPSDYDGRNFSFLPVDTSQPPPGYPGYSIVNKSKVAQAPMPSQPSNLSHSSTNESIIELHNSETSNPKSPREEGEHSDDSENKENQDDVIECDRRHRSRSRSLSRSKRNKRRSRSLSNSRSRHRRSRSRSRNRRSRSREREREREKDRRDRERSRRDREKEKINYERERERKKRGLPPMKKEHLSICSTTLWVGHLSKLVHQEELSDTFGEYGDIVSIDLIPPRGCAFVCMNRRQDATRALIKLKNHKMHNKAITLAWAPGKGVKGKEFKDFWEVDVGCSYIPFSKLSQLSNLDLDSFEDGGMIDEETVPTWLKGRYGTGESSSLAVSQNPPHSHLPPPMVNMSIPPPITSRQERPPPQPITTAPPSLNKDQREENRTGIPPPLLPPFAMQNMPPPGGIPMGAPIIPPNMPPSLPPPIGVPPPLTIPPLNVPPSSNMLGQPLIRVPRHVSPATGVHPPPITSPSLINTSGNSISTHESENMDVEMEDVHKQDTLLQRSPPNREAIGVTEFIESVSKRDLDFEFENSGKLATKTRKGEGEKKSNEVDKRNINSAPNSGNEFRNEGFGTFGPGALPIHRAPPPPFTPGPVGVIPRNGPNFIGHRPIHSFNAQRGMLPAPPPIIGSRPNILSDIPVGNHGLLTPGIGGPRSLGLRPSRLITGSMQNPPRGIVGPSNLVSRFGTPNFPRFGVISGPRQLSLHPSPLDEDQGEWNNPPSGVGRYMKIHPVDEDIWNPEEEMFSQRNRMDKDMPIVPHQRVEDLIRKEDQHIDTLSRNTHHPFEGKPNSARIMNDKFLNGGMRHCDEDKEKDRFRESERDWDRSRERDWDRNKERNWERDRERRGKEWDRGRERDRNRDRDRERDREKDRWRGRERERDRDRERDFNRYNDDNVEKYGDNNRQKEKSFDRSSRWNCDDREETREDKRLRTESLSGSSSVPSEETMTWDNWASFSNFNIVPTLPKNTNEVSSLSSIHEENKNDNCDKKSDVQKFSNSVKDLKMENKSFDTVNNPLENKFDIENNLVLGDDNVDKLSVLGDDNVDKLSIKDKDLSDKIPSSISNFNISSSQNTLEDVKSCPSEGTENKLDLNLEMGKSLEINRDECIPNYPKPDVFNDSLHSTDKTEEKVESNVSKALQLADKVEEKDESDFNKASQLANKKDEKEESEFKRAFQIADKEEEKCKTDLNEVLQLSDKKEEKDEPDFNEDSYLSGKKEEKDEPDFNEASYLSGKKEEKDEPDFNEASYLSGKKEEKDEPDFNEALHSSGKKEEKDEPAFNEASYLSGKKEEKDEPDFNETFKLSDKEEEKNESDFNEAFHSSGKKEEKDEPDFNESFQLSGKEEEKCESDINENDASHPANESFSKKELPNLNNEELQGNLNDVRNDNLLDKPSVFELMDKNVENDLPHKRENFKKISVDDINEPLQVCLENSSNKLFSDEQVPKVKKISEMPMQGIPSADFKDDTKHVLNDSSHVVLDTNHSEQYKRDNEKVEDGKLNPTESELLSKPHVESDVDTLLLAQNDCDLPPSSAQKIISFEENLVEKNDEDVHHEGEKQIKDNILEETDI